MHLVCFSQEESLEEHSISRTNIAQHVFESDADELFQYGQFLKWNCFCKNYTVHDCEHVLYRYEKK